MSKRKDIIRTYDYVRIVLPWFVERVGYPKCVNDYLSEVNGKYGYYLTAICHGHDRADRLRNKLIKEIAYSIAKRDGFGGKKRSLHIIEKEEYLGTETLVSSLRTVVTGTYSPSSGGYSSYEGDYDYEPACLYNIRSHRLATVHLNFEVLEIPTSCLEKINR